MSSENDRLDELEAAMEQVVSQQTENYESIVCLVSETREIKEQAEKNDSATAQELHELRTAIDETCKTLHNIRDLLQAWNDAKGFVKWIGYIATFVKWCGIIGGAVGIVYVVLTKGIDAAAAHEITRHK